MIEYKCKWGVWEFYFEEVEPYNCISKKYIEGGFIKFSK